MKNVVVVFCVVVMAMFGMNVVQATVGDGVAYATLDGSVSSWDQADTVGKTSTVLALMDGVFAGERITHTYIRFDMPTLAPGEYFESATLKIFSTGFWCWTSDPWTTQAAFRVWKNNDWTSATNWPTQPTKFQLLAWPLTNDGDLIDTQYYGKDTDNSWLSWNVLSAMESGVALGLVMDVDRDYTGGGGGIWMNAIETEAGPRIEYTIVPEPVTISLLLVGSVLGLRSRRTN
ncbi:MAG: hypothetical protein LLF92_07140 [Planctomycetaceae bacterium]|nr:hypothetical protein [Planctomycetaceae bacterium]